LTLGPGMEEGSDIGPLISAKERDKVHALVTEARDAGATAVTGGEMRDGPGYFYRPTVLSGVAADSPIMITEIFGPVAPITTFRDEEEVVEQANAVDVGLSSYVFTKDLSRVLRLSERMEVGIIGVNTGIVSNAAAPFGGIKHSGMGREGGTEGIEEFLETVYVGLPA
ncbi:aldehyde dehydrogenase family protein, partial [Georgenia sp. 10Sc9-8]|nr:aldehyde dehydrogenase family protein [Georgenia halotolerans]